MSAPIDPWERAVDRALEQQASHHAGRQLSLDDVRVRARGIRRGRRLAAAGAVLAAIAVLVPVGLATSDVTGSTDAPPVATTPASPSPARDTAVDDTASEDPRFELEDAPPVRPGQETEPGTALGFDWIRGDVLTRADGTTLDLPAGYRSAAGLEDALVGTQMTGSGGRRNAFGLDVLDAEGRIVSSTPVPTGDLARSTERPVVAFPGPEGMTVVGPDAGFEPVGGPGRPVAGDVRTVAVTGSCVPRAFGSRAPQDSGPTGSCEVFYDDGRFRPGSARVVGPSGEDVVADETILSLADVTEDGTLAGVTSSTGDGSCSAVRRDGRAVWAPTCDYSFYAFSPDGSYLAATAAYRDGLGQRWVAILDATTGEEVARYETDDQALQRAVWVDDSWLSIEGVGFDRSSSLSLLGTDGTSRVVARTSRGDGVEAAFVVPEPG